MWATNTLLVPEEICTPDEFQKVFVAWVKKEESKKGRRRH
jgi:hypothetical protein